MSTATLSSAPPSGQMNKIEEEEKEEEPPTFITVLFGDNQSAIFNPRCRSQILLEYIRRRCNCENEAAIDLIDFEGEVKNLSSAKLFDYAHEHQSVVSRESYVLVKVESEKTYSGKREKEQTKFVPLLNNLEEVNPELHDKLNNIVVERPKGKEEKGKKAPKASRNPPTSRRASQSPPMVRRGSRNHVK